MPSASAGLRGNGRASQAGGICRGFVEHVDLDLHLGVANIGPSAGPNLYSLLEGLSRRLGFLGGTAGTRARVVRLASELDRAAAAAQAMAGESVGSLAALRRFTVTRAQLARELTEANAQARALRLPTCVINLRGQAP
jgi:hypothetical protein